MCQVYLLIGGNLGDRYKNILNALKELQSRVGNLSIISSIYESNAWGNSHQPDFFNLAVSINTKLSPINLLNIIQAIENDLGRKRVEKWGARTMDIDILFYNKIIFKNDRLIIPHPLIQNRKFVLEPMFEIASDFKHPIFNKSIKELYLDCVDDLEVRKTDLTIMTT